jgi:copper chaperone NosL
MKVQRRLLLKGLFTLPLMGLIAGCDSDTPRTSVTLIPKDLSGDDECALCGMAIVLFPGPKGQVVYHDGRTLKFCSTPDLLSWWLQPENLATSAAIYVHDMAGNAWDAPDDTRFIDARGAWFVAGSRLKGAMGATLASFASQAAADSFAAAHGGRTLPFVDVTLEVLAEIGSGMG